jgi:hypothetical protein
MGALLQEREALLLRRLQLLGQVGTIARELDSIYTYLDRANESRELSSAFLLAQGIAEGLQQSIIDFFNVAQQALVHAADAADCIVIAGLAVGTDCPQVAFKSAFKAIKTSIFGTVIATLKGLIYQAKATAAFLTANTERKRWLWAEQVRLDHLALRAEDLVRGFEVLTQEVFNVEARIDDLRFQAQHAIDRHQDEVSFAASHLVGRESGFVLLGDHLVGEASAAFRDIVLRAYEMAVAFNHAYNPPPGTAAQLVNRALALVTLDDAAAFVREVDDRARDYCGLEGIDCDAANNVSVLRYSVRENLFPQLRDLVDARTGRVVSAGEQFSNIIQQPPYLHRRVRGVLPADQIELPLAIPVTIKENTADGTPRWLIDPLSCNQLLDARDPERPAAGLYSVGNVAVNLRGRNLGDGDRAIRYELVRGPIDFIRGCQVESVVAEPGTLPVLDYPIRKHVVGYAPQNANARRASPPSFFVRSTPFAACLNAEEDEAGVTPERCWHFFARDRSLASPDWKLVVPLYVDGAATESAWLSGEGLPEADRPVIEDIVLYFRYRSRPIEEQ